jgi:hypothetical protein
MESLSGTSKGCYIVVTASGSRYEVNLGARTLARRPSQSRIPPDQIQSNDFRFMLIGIDTCRLGERAIFQIELRIHDYVYTTLTTTAVRSIQECRARPDDAANGTALGEPTASPDECPPANS